MGVKYSSIQWLSHWDGLPLHCLQARNEPSLARQEVRLRLKELLEHPSPNGYVVRGSYGTGKRELVRAAFQQKSRGLETVWISGSLYGNDIPYGAIHFLLTDLDNDRLDSPLSVYSCLRQHFQTSNTPPVVILEQVELIDGLTIAVFCQLVSNNIIKLVVLDDAVDELSEDLSALVRSGSMEVLRLNALTLAEARTQISNMLGLDVSFLTAARLWVHTAGSPETLRAVVLDCEQAGMFEILGDVTALQNASIPYGLHMEQHIAEWLGRLSVSQRGILDRVALTGDLLENQEKPKHDSDSDFLAGRGLLFETGGAWKLANPALAQILVGEQYRLYPQLHTDDTSAVQKSPLEQHVHMDSWFDSGVACPVGTGDRWHSAKIHALRLSQAGSIDTAIETINKFRSKLPGTEESRMDEVQIDRADSLLVLMRLFLTDSRLDEVATLITSLDPEDPTGEWARLELCQKHQVLAMVAEYHSRTNDHVVAVELVEALLEDLSVSRADSTEYRLSECMHSTVQSLLNTCLGLGDWEHSRSLIKLILAGAIPNPALIAYTESVQAAMLATAGNVAEARKIVVPLQQQLRLSGTLMEQRLIDAIAQYAAVGNEQLHDPVTRGISRNRFGQKHDLEPLTDIQSLWVSIHAAVEFFSQQTWNSVETVESVASRAEAKGENLVASHLWALLIRSGNFHVASRLRALQEGRDHALANAFRLLSDGAQSLDSQTLATAAGDLAALGFVSFATDDGAAIFRYMNAAQRRQASRKANNFMNSQQTSRIRHDIYADLGRLTELTERERFVASAAASGLSNLEIAGQASVSVRTVEGHLYQVYSKLGIKKRAELSSLTEFQNDFDTAR